jgi:hypothetical protein
LTSVPSAPAKASGAEAKEPQTKIDKLVTFGDRFDKFLKPIEFSLKVLGAVAAATTIGHNLGSRFDRSYCPNELVHRKPLFQTIGCPAPEFHIHSIVFYKP